MPSIRITATDNGGSEAINTLKSKVETGSSESVDAILAFGLQTVNQRTPVLTGNLKSGNQTRKDGPDKGELFNEVEYGPYVDRGTSRQKPNPFFSSTVASMIQEAPNIMKAKFSLG